MGTPSRKRCRLSPRDNRIATANAENVYNLFMRRILAASSLFAFTLVGCGGPSMVGDWTVVSDKMPGGAAATANFTSSGYTMNVEAGQGGMNIVIKMDGTYTLKGDQLTMTSGNVTIDDSKIPAAYRSLVAPVQKQLDEQKGKSNTGTIKIEGDVATFNGKDDKGGPITMTFTKVKK